ncbi:MAG: PQQ-like beta-propeller repeat protein, partial [Deltaproteobacteria bacterium]|nr:PQQ-like beta-propeller repeat protein [Deltaproteobacteria bacterium]
MNKDFWSQRKYTIIVLSIVVLICAACPAYVLLSPRSTPPPSQKIDNRPRIPGNYISDMIIYENNLYFGAGYCFFQLNLGSKQLEKRLCSDDQFVDQSVFYKPILFEDKVYAILPDKISALSLNEIEEIWEATDSYVSPNGATTVGSLLILPTGNGSNDSVVTLDLRTGDVLWIYSVTYRLGWNIPFAVQDDIIWVKNHQIQKRFFQKPLSQRVAIALDINTGKEMTTIQTDLEQILAASEAALYIDDGGELISVNTKEPYEIIWKRTIPNVYVQKVIDFGQFLIISNGAGVQAYQTVDGQLMWSIDENSEESP